MLSGALQGQRLRSGVRASQGTRRAKWVLPRASLQSGPDGESTSADAASGESNSSKWWTKMNRKTGIQAPRMFAPGEDRPTTLPEDLLGERVINRMGDLESKERQRVWDAMRASAAHRYDLGTMPDWFDPGWLHQEEEPINRMRRLEEQEELARLASGGDGGGPSGGRRRGPGGGGGDEGGDSEEEDEEEEEDPYWLLRESPYHPMAGWTFAFAAVLAAGGLVTTLTTGYTEALQLGGAAAAALTLSGAAMSAKYSMAGVLGVKATFAICALLALKEVTWGWQHQAHPPLRAAPSSSPSPFSFAPSPPSSAQSLIPRLGLCGTAALAMCAGCLLTDMSGAGEIALPTNPGGVFKSPDVAYKSSVWNKWGYGDITMRV